MFLQSKFPDPLPMQTGSCLNHTQPGGVPSRPVSGRQGVIHGTDEEIGTERKQMTLRSHHQEEKGGWNPVLQVCNQPLSNQLTLQGDPEIFLC